MYVSPEDALEVKRRLYFGEKNITISLKVGINPSYITYIKGGLLAPEVEWPSGHKGAMSQEDIAHAKCSRKRGRDLSQVVYEENVADIPPNKLVYRNYSVADVKVRVNSYFDNDEEGTQWFSWAYGSEDRWSMLGELAISNAVPSRSAWRDFENSTSNVHMGLRMLDAERKKNRG